MIEKQFVNQKLKEFQIQEHIGKIFSKTGYSHIAIKRTPLGENVIVYTTRPGIVVGKKGENIKKLTALLKNKYKLENPQLEIGEIQTPLLDVNYITDRIAASLERFGQKRFKSVGYRLLQNIMDAGAIGAEIVLSGKIPSARARSWRFSAGYLKKSGDIAQSKIHKKTIGFTNKMGSIGIKVSVMTPDILLPDKMLSLKEEYLQPELEEIPFKEVKPEKVVEVSTEGKVDIIEVKEEKKIVKKAIKKKPEAKEVKPEAKEVKPEAKEVKQEKK
jgi:small subunit ribosomal protein S3